MFKAITLQGIRVFEKATFEFSDGVNLIIGKNGSGKTTILEALAVFSFGRFQSIEKDQMAIRKGEQVGRVEVDIEVGESRHKAELAMTSTNKSMKVDGKKLPASQMVGVQRAVLFNPETINLVSGPPQLRRRELDLTIAQNHNLHIKILLEYRQILRQRNELLKRIAMDYASVGELDFWDKRLGGHALGIVQRREAFIDRANRRIGPIYKALLGKNLGLSLQYLPSADYSDFAGALKNKRAYDIRSGLTSIGPHRDDFAFKSAKFKLEEGASRGEQRLAAFAFKLLEREYLSENGQLPALLMDDVFSELDNSRRDMVTEVLSDGQVIVSATDEAMVPGTIRDKANIISV